MTDRYLELVNSGLTQKLAKQLGLPRPAVLRRHRPGQPLLDGPVLVLGTGADSDAVASLLSSPPGGAAPTGDSPAVLDGWDLEVHRHPAPDARYAAVVLVLTGVEHPDDLTAPVLAAASTLKSLRTGARVVTISRPALDSDAPAVAAARQGVDGFLRSLAKELRAGGTGNGVVVAEPVPVTAPSVVAALRFFLSTRSAFVDGQLLEVDSDAGELPTDWDEPLAGKVAVVTGAARGIGAAIADVLARDGATVVAVDVPAAGEQLAQVANRVRGTALQLDVTAPDAGDRILEHARTRHGRLDIVVHNAGITRDKLLANMSDDKWSSVLAVNIASQLRINEALLTSGDFVDAPRIVSLASTSGIAGNRGQTNYAASKGGVIGMVRATAPLLVPFGGTANAVAPGFIETEMTARIPAVTRQVARRLNSLQQGGQPVDVAEAIAFLASPAAGGIVGRTLRVCGQNMVGR
ncbi:3-oxoacyl-ACP reductase [Cellulomonas wangsupingiae]|uniref:3-oxoacyl-ACP reductase n=1 Tax=Cellulomonas wangsupingiae TaxID=2968085 RepID=A0ABY5K229_9CELL|nr:3-oxoacyl-ACP reductase [Cellulomonas wangsupingiae]MCC2336271.1 3-oxoacyl-ACP reductase [Cellulomonas wangsupingiae]MCM0640523.1 3-oxoacyl-ACP reductase [Cellulomonas wangsupingiae]UUI64487.1 3-oxoacyl-ACP reductase [Cellulomonas wangsupingiae]